MTLELRVYGLLRSDRGDNRFKNSLGYINNLTRYKLHKSMDLRDYSINVINGNIEYPSLRRKFDRLVKNHSKYKKTVWQKSKVRGISVKDTEWSIDLHNAEDVIVRYEQKKNHDYEEHHRNVFVVPESIQFNDLAGCPYLAGWGAAPFIRLVKEIPVWHETLHVLGISYPENPGSNCSESYCVMDGGNDQTDTLCEKCAKTLIEELEPHKKVKILKTHDLP